MSYLIYNSANRRQSLRLASLLGGIAIGLCWTANARAANELFLTWPGILGPSSVAGHIGDIDLISYSQNASNVGGKSVCGEITVTKRIDSTSPIFLGMVLSGKATAGPVTVTFAKTPQDTTFYSVRLTEVIPTSITQADSTGPDKLTETIVFSAVRFEFTFTPQSASGGPGTPVRFTWDCRINRGG
jgi:type VI protein secretion system component Hcp